MDRTSNDPSARTPRSPEEDRLDKRCIDTIRTLSMDAVQKANSGHPGTPMAMAPVAYTLVQHALRYDPADPEWPNRDRFVLSVGHASMLLYSVLHLMGVAGIGPDGASLGSAAVTLDDIKHFRQLGSKCPGHPEYRLTAGVETTTGPLGQGCGNSVGMAIAARWLATRFNRPDFPLFDYTVYTLCGDGDMMEGVASEAASLAGHLKLSNLCWIYDSNRISIEGGTDLAFTEDVAARFRAYGWTVIDVADANDTVALLDALDRVGRSGSPTMIVVHSHIGFGAPNKQDTAAAHGEPLGADEVRLAKKSYGWPEDSQFLVPDGVYKHFADGVGRRGRALREDWSSMLERYTKAHPDLAAELHRTLKREPPPGWDADLPNFPTDAKGLATRDSSGKVLNAIAARYPELLGGAADLAPSTKTRLTFQGAGDLGPHEPGGRNLHFGVREHAMGAVVNGLALSHLRAYGSGFLIFSDYMKPSLRLSALMELPSIWIFTHDSIGVGEDGPTHQPIEQLAGLRSIPGLTVLRPADAQEVVAAWRVIIGLKHDPACLVLTRQAVPTLDRSRYAPAAGLARGAYVLADPPDGRKPEVILVGTGSEVSLCVGAYETLTQDGIAARVVSMPSWELFERQDEDYRESVLPPAVTARVSVEQGSVIGWDRYVGMTGTKIGMHTFGSSAPLKDLLTQFGFTQDAVVAAAREQITASKKRSG
ncbi:transketolase [Azospirillum canadense]|uniref:transketolase n=1 Tax=Azospirillum canadense TaxID=403962 RepID=UPI002226AB8A|nr:transketolase [Azospirillum canadense]MCW2240202.1 transketolase [Azospirillum canadense]